MTVGITHQFVNPKADGADATIQRPSDWNAVHDVTGTLLDEGTSFPGSPADGQKKFQTDLYTGFVYDASLSLWLCTCPHYMPFVVASAVAMPLAATAAAFWRTAVPPLSGLGSLSDVWIENVVLKIRVNGGTALSGSHKWVGTIEEDAVSGSALISTSNIDAGSSDQWRDESVFIGALMNGGTEKFNFVGTWTKTGTPGTLYAEGGLSWRYVAD